MLIWSDTSMTILIQAVMENSICLTHSLAKHNVSSLGLENVFKCSLKSKKIFFGGSFLSVINVYEKNMKRQFWCEG